MNKQNCSQRVEIASSVQFKRKSIADKLITHFLVFFIFCSNSRTHISTCFFLSTNLWVRMNSFNMNFLRKSVFSFIVNVVINDRFIFLQPEHSVFIEMMLLLDGLLLFRFHRCNGFELYSIKNLNFNRVIYVVERNERIYRMRKEINTTMNHSKY